MHLFPAPNHRFVNWRSVQYVARLGRILTANVFGEKKRKKKKKKQLVLAIYLF